MKKITILLLLTTINFSACKKDEDITAEETTVATALIYKGILGGAGDEGIVEQQLTISDVETWEALMVKMNSVNNVSGQFSETEIDFSKYRVVAVFDKVRNTGGFSINLSVAATTDQIKVTVSKIVPDGIVTTAITQPYHIIKLKNTSLPIVFE